MRTVYKFWIQPANEAKLFELHKNWRPLHFAYQGPDTALWIEVDTDEPKEFVKLQIFGTGHTIPADASWLGTAVGSVFVWHLYMML
jgi:hypothetical protein